jgi:hypothetical protein
VARSKTPTTTSTRSLRIGQKSDGAAVLVAEVSARGAGGSYTLERDGRACDALARQEARFRVARSVT